MRSSQVGAVVCAVAVAGCGANMTYMRSSSHAFVSKPADCALEVFSAPPQRPFIELGTFDFAPATGFDMTSLRDVLDKARARACADGADAIIARKANTQYRQAIAVRWEAAAAPAPASPTTAPASPAPAPLTPAPAAPASPSAQ